MHRHTVLFVLGLIAAIAPDAARAATDEAFMCRSQGSERRIELQYVEGPDRLPCEVVYWRDSTKRGEGRPVWEAQNDFGFCVERTRDLVQKLQDSGWSCRKVAPDGDDVAAIPALAPHRTEVVSSGERAKLDQAERWEAEGRPDKAAESLDQLIERLEAWVAEGALSEEDLEDLLLCAVDVTDGPDLEFTAISGGASHTCGVSVDGEAYCWGSNADGQLGDGTGIDSNTPVGVAGEFAFRSISAGQTHTC